MSKKKDDDDSADGAPAPTGVPIASVYLLQPVHMRTQTLDGTISPCGNKDHAKFRLFDEGRFLQVRCGPVVRNVPWTHVRHWTPMGAE